MHQLFHEVKINTKFGIREIKLGWWIIKDKTVLATNSKINKEMIEVLK